MKMKLQLIVTAAVILLAGRQATGQDMHFSQFYANPIYLNPAFAGASKCPKLNLNYRNQYPVQGVYETYSASYDQYVPALNGGLGLLVLRDDAGDGAFTTTRVSGVYSLHLQVGRNFQIMTGFKASLDQRNINFSGFTFPDELHPFFGGVRETAEIPPSETNNTSFDVGAGLIGYGERFFFGFNVDHLIEPDVGFYVQDNLPMKFTGHVGFNFPLGKKRLYTDLQNYFIPNILYQRQGPFEQITINAAFSRSFISGGIGYRFNNVNPDAVVASAGYDPEDLPFRLGYSYDFTVSSFSNNLGGAHEISLSYQFPCRKQRKKLEAITCPKF